MELIAAIQGAGRISRIAHGEIGTLLLIGSLVLTFIGYLFVGMDIYDLGVRYKDDILKIAGSKLRRMAYNIYRGRKRVAKTK